MRTVLVVLPLLFSFSLAASVCSSLGNTWTLATDDYNWNFQEGSYEIIGASSNRVPTRTNPFKNIMVPLVNNIWPGAGLSIISHPNIAKITYECLDDHTFAMSTFVNVTAADADQILFRREYHIPQGANFARIIDTYSTPISQTVNITYFNVLSTTAPVLAANSAGTPNINSASQWFTFWDGFSNGRLVSSYSVYDGSWLTPTRVRFYPQITDTFVFEWSLPLEANIPRSLMHFVSLDLTATNGALTADALSSLAAPPGYPNVLATEDMPARSITVDNFDLPLGFCSAEWYNLCRPAGNFNITANYDYYEEVQAVLYGEDYESAGFASLITDSGNYTVQCSAFSRYYTFVVEVVMETYFVNISVRYHKPTFFVAFGTAPYELIVYDDFGYHYPTDKRLDDGKYYLKVTDENACYYSYEFTVAAAASSMQGVFHSFLQLFQLF